ncbi:MAG: MaoC/PaaZ C-terminal domain-containing protein [SAR324 cluster bacterium]|nr:MaoC/PaaZ C-terminal domain-containing protein [SAR324 cluster bacterium]
MKKHPLIEDFYPGLRWSLTRRVSGQDIKASVEFARDHGGYHVDEAFAQAAGFRTLIASGSLHHGIIAGLAGRINLLGRAQSVKFKGPIYAGDTLEAAAVVVEVQPERRQITLEFRITNQDGAEVFSGELTGHIPAAGWGRPLRPGSASG